MCIHTQVACCCCSDTCSLCCSCLPAVKQSTSTRMMYTLFLLCAVFLCCVMLSPEAETLMAEWVCTVVCKHSWLNGIRTFCS